MGPNGLSPLIARARGENEESLVSCPRRPAMAKARYRSRLARHAENLPRLTHDRYEILEELRRKGVVQRDATAMIPGEALEAADRLAARLHLSTSAKPHGRIVA